MSNTINIPPSEKPLETETRPQAENIIQSSQNTVNTIVQQASI